MATLRATVFGEYAAAYHRWRPTYPEAAVDWLLPADARDVVDLGAGTGKLTDRLVGRGLEPDVVEPDPRMLTLVQDRHPHLRFHESSAERIPLADHSVDAVLVADAWHWFDKEKAAAEVERVLRPGGWLGLVWNLTTPVQHWEWELHDLPPGPTSGASELDPLEAVGLRHGRAERAGFGWDWQVSPQEWRGFRSTESPVALLAEPARTRVLDAAQRVIQRACAESGRDTVPIHHEASCVRWWPA